MKTRTISTEAWRTRMATPVAARMTSVGAERSIDCQRTDEIMTTHPTTRVGSSDTATILTRDSRNKRHRRAPLARFLAALGAATLLALVAVWPAAAAPGDTVSDRVFGQGGSFATSVCDNPSPPGSPTAGSLCDPLGAAVDGAGNLYVADSRNNRVLEYDSPLTT